MDWQSILNTLIILVHFITDKLLELFLGCYWGPRKICSRPVNEEEKRIVEKGAVELAQLIRGRKLKSFDVVKAYINRMKSLNRELNAIVDGPFEEALNEAKLIDTKLENGEYSVEDLNQKPFLGVPFTTKDSTSVKGKLHTLGLLSRRNERSDADAECVKLMKESGAIILATSNIPEVNKWIESRNMLFGQTNNPYDLRRSVGGSSGGEAALISSCCTAFGLGTDIGGSIRIPAFNCGIYGHKPTTNVVNTKGCTFRTGKEKNTMVVAGPMARKATDLMPIFKVIVYPNMIEKLKLNNSVDLKRLRYFYIPNIGMKACNPVNLECQRVMFKVCQHIKELTGNEVQLAQLPELKQTHKLWSYWMTQEPANFNKLLGNGATLNPIVELIKKLLGQSEFTLAAIYSLIDGILPKPSPEKMLKATEKCKNALKNLLGDDGVLLFHSSPRTAPFHYYPLMKFLDFSYFSIFNVLQVPVTQVPMGLDSNGLPLGIQVVAGEMNDRYCLAVAEELERGFNGWVPPYEQ